MKKFQMKNKLRVSFFVALVCAVLFSGVFLLNSLGSETKNNQVYASVSEPESIVSGLVQDGSTLETKYNLTDSYPLLPENQTTSNLCWIYSSSKVLESSLMVQKGEFVNISETAMAYLGFNYGIRDTINSTGKFETFSTIASTYGLVYESDFSNDKYFDITDENYKNYSYVLEKTSRNVIDSVSVVPISTTESYLTSASKQNIIKKYIKTYGGVFAGLEDGIIYTDGGYFYDTDKTLEAEKSYLNGSHAVCIVGWNDNYGFIALNSWGTEISQFYIPYNYEYVYTTFYGYHVSAEEEIETVSSSTSSFNSNTKYDGTLENVFCYGDDVSFVYEANENVSFESIFINIYKGAQDVTSDFEINFDDTKKQIAIEFTNKSNRFVGGNYLIYMYENGELHTVKSIYIFTGTEISNFALNKDDLAGSLDSELLNAVYLSSDNSVTYYLDPVNSYKLSFSLTDMNKYLTTSQSLTYSMSTPYAYSTDEATGEVTSEKVNANFVLDSGILCDIQNSYDISIPQLYNYTGKIIKFSVTIKSNIASLSACSQTYYINIIVSELSSTTTASAYAIEYVLDGGVNSVNNLERYAVFAKESSMTGFVLEDPTRVNSTFVGWYTTPTFEDASRILKIDGSLASDIALYARWEENIDIEYFTSTFDVVGVTDYNGKSKNFADGLIYGDKISMQYVFTPTQELEKFSYYSVEYFYYVNGELVNKALINKNDQQVTKVHAFPELVVGEYEAQIEVFLSITHSTSISDSKVIKFSVAQKEISISFSDLEYTYDGECHRPKINYNSTDIYAEDAEKVEIYFEENSVSFAKTYTFEKLVLSNDNYKLVGEKSCILIINKKALSIVWNDIETVYNGKSQLPTYSVEGLIANDTISISVNSDQEMVNAGTYQLSADSLKLGNENYYLTDTECEFTIKKADVVITFADVVDRSETDPIYRKKVTYTITGLLEDESVLNLVVVCEALTATESGEYEIHASTNAQNYNVTINPGIYKLTGYYYVYYTLPNGETYIEKVDDGADPKGITEDIYPLSIFQKYVYSEELKCTGYDLHIVVTIKSYTWVVIAVGVVALFVIVYWFVTRKQRRNKVS